MTEIRKFELMGKQDPILVLAEEVRQLRNEHKLLLDEAEKVVGRAKLVSRAALAGCILLSLELILDIVFNVLRVIP
jgi:hypothetical protein